MKDLFLDIQVDSTKGIIMLVSALKNPFHSREEEKKYFSKSSVSDSEPKEAETENNLSTKKF